MPLFAGPGRLPQLAHAKTPESGARCRVCQIDRLGPYAVWMPVGTLREYSSTVALRER